MCNQPLPLKGTLQNPLLNLEDRFGLYNYYGGFFRSCAEETSALFDRFVSAVSVLEYRFKYESRFQNRFSFCIQPILKRDRSFHT